jgi:hypothetical protein
MTNKSAFAERDKPREEETAPAQEKLAMAYQAHALAQALVAHYMTARPWAMASMPAGACGPIAFQAAPGPYFAPPPGFGVDPHAGAAPYGGVGLHPGPMPCYGMGPYQGESCRCAPAMQGVHPMMQTAPWPASMPMATAVQFAPWAFPFVEFFRRP